MSFTKKLKTPALLVMAMLMFAFQCSALKNIASQISSAVSSGNLCGNGVCDALIGENTFSCAADCAGGPPATANCGNGVCEFQKGETPTSCAADCAGAVSGGSCGDGICDIAAGENSWCAGVVNSSNPNGYNDCATMGYCGDGICQSTMGENAGWCSDCGTVATCGNGVCDAGEAGWCADCGSAGYCGDGICQTNLGENSGWCSSDCGAPTGYCGDGVCATDGSEQYWCADCGAVGYCGDGTCQSYESNASCPSDCLAIIGTDGICSADEVILANTDCPSTATLVAPFAYTLVNTANTIGQSVRVDVTVPAGTTYTINWDDFYSGSGFYTADVWVNAWDETGAQFIFHQDSGYLSPVTHTSTTGGTWIFEINAGWTAGTVGLQIQ